MQAEEKITTRETIEAFAAANNLTIETIFVPWSQSRSFKANEPVSKRNLNWRVTLKNGARRILETDYSAGIGHCPSYKQNAKWLNDYTKAIKLETENGFPCRVMPSYESLDRKRPILPGLADVLYSLANDSDVLDYSNFEQWAREFGYEEDSRSAEKTYRACLNIALSLRNGLGEKLLAELREAVSGF